MVSTTCELTWNLDRIYPSFESEGFQQDHAAGGEPCRGAEYMVGLAAR